jgi:hypothetical protein
MLTEELAEVRVHTRRISRTGKPRLVAGRNRGDLNAVIRRAGAVPVEQFFGETFQRATPARIKEEG